MDERDVDDRDDADERDEEARRGLLTALAVVVAGAVLAVPIVVAAFWSWVTWRGCFIECQEPNRPAALLLGAGALLMIADVVACGVVTWKRPALVWVIVAWTPVAIAVVIWIGYALGMG